MIHSKNDTVAITYDFDQNDLVENVLPKTILLYEYIVFGMTHHNTNGTGAVCTVHTAVRHIIAYLYVWICQL